MVAQLLKDKHGHDFDVPENKALLKEVNLVSNIYK